MLKTRWLCVVAALGLFSIGKARAEELEPLAEPHHELHPWSASALLGYGVDFEDGDLNAFGFGLGLRGGYKLDEHIYLGGQFNYFFGDSVDAGAGELSLNVITIGVEGGYDLYVDPVVIRPSLGLGIAIAHASTDISGVSISDSKSNLYIAPGASVLYPIEDKYFVGGDARLWFITSDPGVEALTIMATAGMNF